MSCPPENRYETAICTAPEKGKRVLYVGYGNMVMSKSQPITPAKVVPFYPPLFSERPSHWDKHFTAYVRGATGVAKLDDLGYKY